MTVATVVALMVVLMVVLMVALKPVMIVNLISRLTDLNAAIQLQMNMV